MIPYGALATFIDRLDNRRILESNVLAWACPVPYFGGLSTARIATVGINPSVREFTMPDGSELVGAARRFPTIQSLDLARWGDVDASHITKIADACNQYFSGNPYRRWFDVLETLVGHAGYSYYDAAPSACHVDLVPYATLERWGQLAGWQRRQLIWAATDLLGAVLLHGSITTLILNGRSVIDHFSNISNVEYSIVEVDTWRLTGGARRSVPGMAFTGLVTRIGSVNLDAPINIVGFNHNLQSSFGVRRSTVAAVGQWLASTSLKHSE